MILAGDIGGTKCNLALVEKQGAELRVVLAKRYASREYTRFDDLIAQFLADTRDSLAASAAGKVRAAGFGFAGPVIGDEVRLTNLPWKVEGQALRKQLDTPHIVLLNDLEATGYSVPWLRGDDLFTLSAGTRAAEKAQALIAAGTGLGEAVLRWNGSRYIVEPSEGGHCDLAPRTEKEIELLRHLKKSHPSVSFEMVLGGRGFLTIHRFLDPTVQHSGFDDPESDPAPEITRLGLEGGCAVCVATLDLWTALYGAEAGNLALKALARGGLYVAGGIVAKVLPKMKDGTFFRAFCAKDKFKDLLAQIPIRLILNQEAPLLGAAAEAARVVDA